MNSDFLSNTIGFLGNTSYSLKYISNTRNLRYRWPHNNIFAQSHNENTLLQSILHQQVGIDRSSTYHNQCSKLKSILLKFLKKHAETNYVELLEKCDPLQFNKNGFQSTPRYIVKEYIHKLIHNVVPLALFGNKLERRVFERNVRQIIHLGKAQVFNLSMLMRNVRTKNKIYLEPLNCNIDRTNLVAKLYVFILRCYIFAALKCVFYVTDSNQSKKYLFYNKHTWQRIQQQTFNQMRKDVLGTYKNCLITRVVSSHNLYILRILPKRRGGRPIYMKWKLRMQKPSRFSVSLVQMVKQFFLQLARDNFVYAHNMANFHEKWEALYLKWELMQRPPVYFVKADFSDAYGSILQTKLLQSIEEVLARNQHIREIECIFRKKAKRVPVRYISAVIKDYITKFIYKHDKNIYCLAKGISQGGPLSSILCNFYFGLMDLEHLEEFGKDNSGFLVRNCDDYLYITTDFMKAFKFLNRLTSGFPDYNLKLNDEKTETNIFSDPNTLSLVRITTFELDINSFQLYRSFYSYKNNSIFHTSFLQTITHPGQILAMRLPLWVESNLNQPYFNMLYNSTLTILCNTFQSANLTAARFIAFIEVLFQHFNSAFISKCIYCVASQMASSILKRATTLGDNVSRALLTWIVLKAFLLRFQKSESRYQYALIIRHLCRTLQYWTTKFNASEIIFLMRLRSDDQVQKLHCIL